MNFYHFLILIVLPALLAGCATPTTSQFRKITPDEAFSFVKERANGNTELPQDFDHLYVQPANKTEPCKLPTSQEQIDRGNFRAYWDGQCKGGFAYGLGRDIAISNTHHYEEITIYGDNGTTIDAPSVHYDFVHNVVGYKVNGSEVLEYAYFKETITSEPGSFIVQYELGEVDGTEANIAYWSPFNSVSYLQNSSGGVVYRYSVDKAPPTNTDATFVSETLDGRSGDLGGFAAVKYANGQVRHFDVRGGQKEQVVLPQEYISIITAKYKEAENAISQASKKIERAKMIEKEYFHLACNGKHEIRGLEKEVATKICTWREQFHEPFEVAQKQYSDYLEKINKEARSQEEQRRIQEQLEYQERMARAAERQAEAAEGANFQNLLNSFNQNKQKTCYSNFGITTCY